MKWFRLYSEARNDAKLRTLTAEEHRVWFHLLCYAGEQNQRGTVPADDRDVLAVEVAGADSELLAQTIAKLVKLRILTDDGDTLTFLHFADRQYDKPSARPERVTARVRQSRNARAETVTPGNALKRAETPRNAGRRTVTPHTTDTDPDTESDQAPQPPSTNGRAPAVVVRSDYVSTYRLTLGRNPPEDEWSALRAIERLRPEVGTAELGDALEKARDREAKSPAGYAKGVITRTRAEHGPPGPVVAPYPLKTAEDLYGKDAFEPWPKKQA